MSVACTRVSAAEFYSFRVQLDATPATTQPSIVGRYNSFNNTIADPQRIENQILATAMNGTTPVDLVPAAFVDGAANELAAASIVNLDTANRTLTFTIFDGISVTKTKWVFMLRPGEVFVYEAERGVEILTAEGAIK